MGFLLFIAAWAHPFGIVAIRRTVFSDSMGVAICALGLFVAIWSREALGAESSQDVEIKARAQARARWTLSVLPPVGLLRLAGLTSFVLGLWVILNQKEGLILRSFPDKYPAYKTRVKALIPYLFGRISWETTKLSSAQTDFGPHGQDRRTSGN